MQLRVPKQYQRSKKRRSLGFRRLFIKLVLLGCLSFGAFWMVSHPELTSQTIDDTSDLVQERVLDTRQRFFPPEPTPTPDVRAETINAENAYLNGNIDEAIAQYRIAITGHPNDVMMHYRLARMLIVTSDLGSNRTRLEEAIRVADLAINANPESSVGYIIKAMALDWYEQDNIALAYAERALEMDENSALAKAVLANIYRNLGNSTLAKEELEEAIDIIKQSPDTNPEIVAQVYRNYGRFLVSQFEGEAAEEYYTIAYQAMPHETYIAVELASYVYYVFEDYQQAIVLLQEVRKDNPRDPSILYWLAVTYSQVGNPNNEAEEVLALCTDANPNYVPCLSMQGRLQYFAAEYIKTIDTLERATELGSTNPYDWYLLGRAYYRIDRCDQAIQPLTRGYVLIRESAVPEVDQSNFVQAGRDCNYDLE